MVNTIGFYFFQRERKPKPKEPDVEPHVYPFRKKRMTSYMALAIPDDDDFLCKDNFNILKTDDAKNV